VFGPAVDNGSTYGVTTCLEISGILLNVGKNLVREKLPKTRDVPDIRFRFRLAGYPAVFFYPVPAPVPAEMVPGTG